MNSLTVTVTAVVFQLSVVDVFFLEDFMWEAGLTEPVVATKNPTKESANQLIIAELMNRT